MTAEAHLFPNGNAIFFDEEGEQIPELQKHGISGVHEYRDRYPDAPVYWSIWRETATEVHDNLFDHITEP